MNIPDTIYFGTIVITILAVVTIIITIIIPDKTPIAPKGVSTEHDEYYKAASAWIEKELSNIIKPRRYIEYVRNSLADVIRRAAKKEKE